MILATYQPITPQAGTPFNKLAPQMLEDYLGFKPIWCFAANSWQEFFTNSMLAAPNYPEELYVFESEDCIPIDVVRWNKLLYMLKQGEDIQSSDLKACFDITDKKYCEYIVCRVPEDLLFEKINIEDAIFYTKYISEPDDSLSDVWSQLANLASERAATFVERSSRNIITSGSIDPLAAKRRAKLRIAKTAFEIYLALFLVGFRLPAASPHEIFSSYHPDLYFDKMPQLTALLADNYNGVQMPTYERQNEILALIDSCFKPRSPWGDSFVGRNDPCPCGSGKKFKKCCIDKYYYK